MDADSSNSGALGADAERTLQGAGPDHVPGRVDTQDQPARRLIEIEGAVIHLIAGGRLPEWGVIDPDLIGVGGHRMLGVDELPVLLVIVAGAPRVSRTGVEDQLPRRRPVLAVSGPALDDSAAVEPGRLTRVGLDGEWLAFRDRDLLVVLTGTQHDGAPGTGPVDGSLDGAKRVVCSA